MMISGLRLRLASCKQGCNGTTMIGWYQEQYPPYYDNFSARDFRHWLCFFLLIGGADAVPPRDGLPLRRTRPMA